jgi:hypothetical protein
MFTMPHSDDLSETSRLSVDSTAEVPANPETRPITPEMVEKAKASVGSALLHEQTGVRLRVAESGAVVSVPVTARVVIGRSEINKIEGLNIDLTPFGARVMGVSRRHAVVYRMRNSLFIEDLDSVNGSYVNGQRLTPGHPQLLHNGDEIRFGNLRCSIEFNQDAVAL